ncbi:MAG: PIN domain-containing protein [Candidatus Doudnabacteria bacterium]|nr:PIN domain-containing protein [Candidatus Doudnabacteria bacterium]
MEPDRFIIDSNIFVAAYYEGDSNHKNALKVLSELNKKTLIVHPYVIQETATVLTYKLGQYVAIQFLKDIQNATNAVIPVIDVQSDIRFFISVKKKISFTDAALVGLATDMSAGLVTFDKQMLGLAKK